ncbi:DDE superfamily endonuclease [Kribbella sp. VKM Ac-2568]|nr:DDE superfamily endonuclease [Kribbella sp. VKM Ac-2568]
MVNRGVSCVGRGVPARATLDVPAETAYQVARWLSNYRNTHDARPWQRVATPFVQAVMALRWVNEAIDVPSLARDAGVSVATASRYLHEAIDVIADQAPDLPDVLAEGLRQGWAFVCLDGTLIPSTRVSAPSQAGHDLWYSGKHKQHGGNVQVLTDPTGYPVGVSDVEPGSTHDITAARIHALPALYPAATHGLPTRPTRATQAQAPGSTPPPRATTSPPTITPGTGRSTHYAPRQNAPTPCSTHLESPRARHPRPLENRPDHHRSTGATQTPKTSPVRRPH